MEKPTIVSIDCGGNGGIAIYKKDWITNLIPMPKNLSDLKVYLQYIKDNNENVMVFIEKVQMFMSDSDEENKGKQFRIANLLSNYNQIKALITFYGFQYVQVYPQTWQSALGFKSRGLESTVRKNLYKRFAENSFPAAKVTLATSDALCILKFALMKYEEDYAWIVEKTENKKTEGLF